MYITVYSKTYILFRIVAEEVLDFVDYGLR